MNKQIKFQDSESAPPGREGSLLCQYGKTILTLGLVLICILVVFGCSGAAPEMMPASTEIEAEAAPEEPSAGEPVLEETAVPLPEVTEVASAAGETPAAEPPEDLPAESPEERVGISTLPERRLLTYERPPRIRVGDSDVVRIVLEVDETGQITPTAFFAEHEIEVQAVEILNLYDTHIIRAEARLEMAGIVVAPSASIDRRLNPGEPVEFSWSIVPDEPGTYRGNVWVFLRYLPQEEGEILEKTLFSQPLEIQAVNLLGLGGQSARWLGAAGTFVTTIFGLDDVIKLLNRVRKGKSGRA